MQKRIGIIGCAGIPANYGGFETLVENLVKELKDDFRFTVYCSAFSYKIKRLEYYSARLIYIPVKANGRSSILYDVISLFNAINKVDVVIVLGVGGAFLFPLIKWFTRRRIVVNIDGLEWKRQKWGLFARFYLRVQEKIAIKFAHNVIADNETIKDYILKEHNRESHFATYGGNHATYVQLEDTTRKELNIIGSDYYFSVCRIEPENNIHIILKAFSMLPETKLILVGNWWSSKYGRSLQKNYRNFKNILLHDPIYDSSKLNELRSNCFVYVHGHSAGGTNPSLVEAMNLGLAVIAWDVDYNRNTTENQALYFRSFSELKALVLKINNNQIDLQNISRTLRQIGQNKYHWRVVAQSYKTILNSK